MPPLDLVAERLGDLPVPLRAAAIARWAWRMRGLVLLERPKRRADRVRYGYWLRTGERQWMRV